MNMSAYHCDTVIKLSGSGATTLCTILYTTYHVVELWFVER